MSGTRRVRSCFPFLLLLMLLAAPLYAGAPLQTQDATQWSDIAVDLLSVQTKNGVLTMRFIYRNNGERTLEPEFGYGDFHLIDEVNQKKYFPLKDADGIFIAGPIHSDYRGGTFKDRIPSGGRKGVWIKFPVPADNPESITVSVPGVFPFEDVALPH
ncbi:MAG: hypothetical protein JW781_06085 [Deltaproteobacteria bacterium]|nr:hypothetical protein [Candidatus Anaeroferrophillacea bacterium]